MIPSWLLVLCEIAVVSTALVSGLFLTFSDFLMRSFGLAKPAAGIQVMQILNREIWKSLTMVLLWGSLALNVGLAAYAYLHPMGTISALLILGGVLYVLGGFGVTFTTNVPMNNRLDTMDYSSDEAAAYWFETYVPRWTFWNWIRAYATGGTAICFLLASVALAQMGN